MTKQSKPKQPEFWAQIDPRCKPSAASSKEKQRPALQHGFISHESKGKSWLYVTDAYVMARIPITFPNTDSKAARTIAQRRDLLPPARALPPVALKALDKSKTGCFRVEDGGKNLRVDGEEVLHPLADPEAMKGLYFVKLFKEREALKATSLGRATFNPNLLGALAKALGGGGVRLRFGGQLKPILVESLSGTGAEGMLMPMLDTAAGDSL